MVLFPPYQRIQFSESLHTLFIFSFTHRRVKPIVKVVDEPKFRILQNGKGAVIIVIEVADKLFVYMLMCEAAVS